MCKLLQLVYFMLIFQWGLQVTSENLDLQKYFTKLKLLCQASRVECHPNFTFFFSLVKGKFFIIHVCRTTSLLNVIYHRLKCHLNTPHHRTKQQVSMVFPHLPSLELQTTTGAVFMGIWVYKFSHWLREQVLCGFPHEEAVTADKNLERKTRNLSPFFFSLLSARP